MISVYLMLITQNYSEVIHADLVQITAKNTFEGSLCCHYDNDGDVAM